jgi:hypothetical protein
VTTPTKTPAKSGAPAQAAPRPYPFPVGVYESTVQDYDNTVALGATVAAWTTPVQAPMWNISPTGWLRALYFDFTLFFASGNAAGAFAGDAPWSLIQKVYLYDLGGEVILFLLGYEWMNMNKWGGYYEAGDPRADLAYVTNPAAGNSQGSPAAHFNLILPLEVVARDSLGVVQNEAKPGWKVELWFDTAANAVGTGGTAFTSAAVSPQVRYRGYIESYTEPAASAPNGRPFAQSPPLPGTLQYWKSENNSLPSGTAKYDLTNGVGFAIRNMILYVRDAGNGTRATADGNWPDPFTLLVGNVNYFTRGKNMWISKLGRTYSFNGVGSTAPAADTANGRENGVFPVWFTQDMTNLPGAELRFKYLDTQVNTLVRSTGVFGGTTTFFIMANWLATPSRNRYALIAG